VKQQLNSRGIGASEISAVCGTNPFCSPWDIWLRKTGQKADQIENPAMEWGHRLEPAIRQKYVDDTQLTVYVPPESLYHPERNWARATPDGIIVDGTAWQYILQCKNVGYWVEKAWADAPPSYVQIQEQWEMDVTGLARADVAVLIGGSDYRVYTVHRDDGVIADLVTLASDFWRRVEQRIPPEIDNSDACREHFESKFAKSQAVEIVADEEVEGLFRRWQANVDLHKSTGREIGRIRNVVRSHLADAQADRIVSSLGIAKLVKSEVTGKQTLYSPREWAKEEQP